MDKKRKMYRGNLQVFHLVFCAVKCGEHNQAKTTSVHGSFGEKYTAVACYHAKAGGISVRLFHVYICAVLRPQDFPWSQVTSLFEYFLVGAVPVTIVHSFLKIYISRHFFSIV